MEALRTETITTIRDIVQPHLRDSNFVESSLSKNARYLKVATFLESKTGTRHTLRVENPLSLTDFSGNRIEEIEGFTDDGVITDAYAGLVVQSYEDICLEDLLKIRQAAELLKDDEFN